MCEILVNNKDSRTRSFTEKVICKQALFQLPTVCFNLKLISSVIRQKGESQNACFKKTKHVKFSEKQTFLTP